MLDRLFVWWNSTTFGTSFTLWRRGARQIGEDQQGNRYFQEKEPSSADGTRRRWVIYHGVAEASRVPSEWHGWLHHTFDEPPTTAPLTRRDFEIDHAPNMTGTPLAYHPKGSLARRGGPENVETYEAWSPESSEQRF